MVLIVFSECFGRACDCNTLYRTKNQVMASEKGNRKGIRVSDEELALYASAMERDGIKKLATWMKWVCTRYAQGELVSRNETTEVSTGHSEVDEIIRQLKEQVEELVRDHFEEG